ncbi:hypothetical protein CRG98_022909 [Punica granatum]|uniref:DUF7745 domain-containing protein n=1 Tax=Punica granatum TaxID=22663 RepID=A0A2I0JL86_PUNGR|nr:hypothetical protein CRG98_022909 [Punica granatum]
MLSLHQSQTLLAFGTFRPVDHAFLQLIIGDLPLLADSPIDWTLLRTAISFWDTQRPVFDSQETKLAPTVEEYVALIQRPMSTRDIVVPNQFSKIQSRPAILLGLHDEEIRRELQHGWEHSIRTAWLADFIHIRALHATGESYQRDACHGFLLLIFGTILFSYSSNLINGALAHVILQVVGGHSYVEAVLAETIRSLDYVRELMEGLTPARFLWAAHWNPGGPMAIRCPSLYFPEHPIDHERAFSTTAAYVAQLHPHGLAPVRQPCTAPIPRTPQADIPEVESSIQAAMRTELSSIREERERLHRELIETRSKLTDQRELQGELAQAYARVTSQDREIAHLSATLDRAGAKARKVSHS